MNENKTFRTIQDIVYAINHHLSSLAAKPVGDKAPDTDFSVLQNCIVGKLNKNLYFELKLILVVEIFEQLLH